MRTTRIYQSNINFGNLNLEKKAAHHVANVLRLNPGETIILFNGKGEEYIVKIKVVKRSEVLVDVQDSQQISRESPLNIHLLQSISRGNKMDFSIQKAVELGVSTITPLLTERCTVKLPTELLQKRLERWNSIIISSCEQCGRNLLPKLNKISYLSETLQKINSGTKLILHPTAKKRLQNVLYENKQIAMLIGPEGGFSESEIDFAQKCDFIPIYLGPRILRTETAGLAALAGLQILFGDAA